MDEAARLLRKSLIHVETDDVVLGDVPARRQKKNVPGTTTTDPDKPTTEDDGAKGKKQVSLLSLLPSFPHWQAVTLPLHYFSPQLFRMRST